jgi:hypothetical protein
LGCAQQRNTPHNAYNAMRKDRSLIVRRSFGSGYWRFANPLPQSKKEKPVTPVFSPLPNALTMQVVMAQRPASISEEKWRVYDVETPLSASLIPIRITQAMLDTIDGQAVGPAVPVCPGALGKQFNTRHRSKEMHGLVALTNSSTP